MTPVRHKNDINLLMWCCEDHLLPDGSIRYENEINKLKRNNKQSIALTDDARVYDTLSSASDLFINVLLSENKENTIKEISEEYRIRPRDIAIIHDGQEPFDIEGYNFIHVQEALQSLNEEQNRKIYVSEPPEVMRYREKRFESREEAIELLREIYRKYDIPWVKHELTDFLARSTDPKERSEAYRICRLSSSKDPEMKFKLARMYKMGIGTGKDMDKYMVNLKELMLGGSNKAKYEWIRNVIDRKVSDEYEEALKLLDESDSQLRGYLAKMYSRGQGVKQDLDKAIELMGSSAEDGLGWARNELTDLLVQRNKGDDVKQAFEKCSDFASEGDLWAKGRLARMYRYGIGTKKDMDKAKSLMSEAAEGGVPWARKEIEEILKDEISADIPQNISKYLFDDTDKAFRELDLFYEKDPKFAKDALIKIEELNRSIMNPDINVNIIRQKIKMDDGSTQALNELTNIALRGNRVASEMLGNLYSEGDVVERNVDLAITYARLSTKGSTGREVNKLIDLLMERGRNEDLTEAYEICLRSSREGDAWSTGRLGRMYKNGKGVEKNTDEAIKHFRTASNGGVTWAKDELNWLLEQRNTAQDVKELKKL